MERALSTYVHDGDACSVQLVDCELGRDTDRADEEGGFLLDDHINELRELAFGVVILIQKISL